MLLITLLAAAALLPAAFDAPLMPCQDAIMRCYARCHYYYAIMIR